MVIYFRYGSVVVNLITQQTHCTTRVHFLCISINRPFTIYKEFQIKFLALKEAHWHVGLPVIWREKSFIKQIELNDPPFSSCLFDHLNNTV
jgi:hypothetical protein